MLDTILFLFIQMLPFLGVLIFLLICFKTYLYINNKSSSWKVHNYFYFEHSNIEKSHSESGQKNKRVQNSLSLTIVILMLFEIAGLLFKHVLIK